MLEQFAAHEKSALKFLRGRLGCHAADAEEILQRIYLRIWKCPPRAIKNPRAYLGRACANGVNEYFRKATRRSNKVEVYRTRARTAPGAFDLEDFRDDRRFRCLTQGELRVAWLVAVGFTVVQAAAHLGISPGAARTRLYEARKHFARRVA